MRECSKDTCRIMGRPTSKYVVSLRPRAGDLGMGRAGVMGMARLEFPQGGLFQSKCASPHRDETRWREGKVVVVVVVVVAAVVVVVVVFVVVVAVVALSLLLL